MKRRKKRTQIILPDEKLLKKCVRLLKEGKNSQKEVIGILEKEVKDINKAGKN